MQSRNHGKTRTRPGAEDIITQEGGVVRAKSDDVQKAWNLYHRHEESQKERTRVSPDSVPEGMEGSYYL